MPPPFSILHKLDRFQVVIVGDHYGEFRALSFELLNQRPDLIQNGPPVFQTQLDRFRLILPNKIGVNPWETVQLEDYYLPEFRTIFRAAFHKGTWVIHPSFYTHPPKPSKVTQEVEDADDPEGE